MRSSPSKPGSRNSVAENDYVVGSAVLAPSKVPVITEKGCEQANACRRIPTKGRGGKGNQDCQHHRKNGLLAGLVTAEGTKTLC